MTMSDAFETYSVHHRTMADADDSAAPPGALPARSGTEPMALVAAALAQIANLLAVLSASHPEKTKVDITSQIPAASAIVTSPGDATPGASQILTHHPALAAGPEPVTLIEAINAFIIYKAKMNASDENLRYLRQVLTQFNRGRSQRFMATLTAKDVQEWVLSFERRKTMQTYTGAVRTFFRYCVRAGWMTRDLTQDVELPRDSNDSREPAAYTPAETKKILRYLQGSNLDLCRLMAIRFFAGLRTAEAIRLDEEDILLDQGVIRLPKKKAKTRSRRLIPIQPNLRAWLALGGELRGFAQGTIREAIQAAGVVPKPNGTRDSFISYHFAKWENDGRTAAHAGNSPEMLHKHYKALVTKKEAEAFWKILPDQTIEFEPATNPGWFQKGWRKKKNGGSR